jgi:LuxR family maltose regulon positive regulatory protein
MRRHCACLAPPALHCPRLSTARGAGGSGEPEEQATDSNGTAAPAGTTTLTLPVPRWAPVPRRRLYARLDEGVQGPLTLLAAPAGYGKTLLLSSWAAASRPPGPVAWVTVDPDDQAGGFWRAVLDALGRAGVATPGGPLAGVDARPGGGHGFVRALAGWLAELPGPVVLVLDDLHEATGGPVAAQLSHLLRHPPPQLRLVVATRADPPLPLQRLRVAGQLGEIREADLAFTLAEARALVGDQGVELSEGELETLWRRTEGWAAGLRLAALSLQDHPAPGRFVDELAGDDRTIAGYLIEEVLAAQPPELRSFLLRTCLPDRLCGDLADALTGRGDGAQVLGRLEREHVFTSACGLDRTWYRYHPLFAELLRAELRHERPEEPPALYRRSAAWHAANGLPVEAVRHALAGGDVDQAAELVAAAWLPLLAGGRAASLRELLARLPPRRVRTSPELAAVAAIGHLALGELEEADAWLGSTAAARPRSPRFAAGAGTAVEVARLLRARLVGDADEAVPAARRLLGPAPQAAPPGLDHPDGLRALATGLVGSALLWSGQLDAAAAHLEQARADAGRSGLDYIELDATAQLALLESFRGDLGRADRLGRQAGEQGRRGDWPDGVPLACAELAVAVAAYHRDELAAATVALERATEAAGGDRLVLLVAATLAAWLAAGRPAADHAEALGRLDGAVRAARGRPPWLLEAARATRARLLAAAGDDRAALAELGGDGRPRPPVEAVTLARLELAGGDPAAAVMTVAPFLDGPAGRPAVPGASLAIEAALVDAAANQELGDQAAAAGSLRRALDLAAPKGYRRAFVEAGLPVRMLLVDHLHRDPAHRDLAGALVERLRDSAVASPRPARPAPGAAVLMEPLSERERVVLRYLPSTLSAAEIAGELYVSLNTVKTHIKNIYRKLDTNRRWDAVRRARQLKLF